MITLAINPNIIKFNLRYLNRFISTSKYLREKDLSPGYKPREVESCLQSRLVGCFPEKQNGKIYSMVLPPPNITGNLHLGHAINLTIQDVLARWHKLNGYEIMWVPGFDHAGIATQVVVEKQLLKQMGKTRHEIGREAFTDHILKWKHDKSKVIKEQLLKMGVLLNWEKEVFTLDQSVVEAVNEAFIRLFEDGLIYRDNALVNWCCYLQSALSDIEVEMQEISGPTFLNIPGYEKPVKFGVITEFAYKLFDMDGEIIVATTRPETIHGDVAVAVSPKDPRYSHLRNAKVLHPFHNTTIPIIHDELVDAEFGTGAMKVTPAHDIKDFEIAQKHNLPIVQIINEKGYMNENCGKFSGLKRYDARDLIIDELRNLNLFKQNKDHPMTLPTCSRTGDVIELLIKPQWFMDCKQLANSAVQSVKDGHLEIEPKMFEQNWFNWLNNIRDWCISRQLWWGHKIPVYECYNKNNPENKKYVAAKNNSEALLKAKMKFENSSQDIVVKQDSDVLDTWFSSALFPFSVHGWPQQSHDLDKYYPLSIMQTGHDILFFWVARMVMLGKKLLGNLPFQKILLHGIICDLHGRKMSKSLGNTIEPEDVINGVSFKNLQKRVRNHHEMGILSSEEMEKSLDGLKKIFHNGIPECGIDALRFTLCSKNIKTHFINFDVSDCYANKLFGNKIWQATIYTKLLVNACRANNKFEVEQLEKENLSVMDLWILSKLANLLAQVNTSLENADFHLATGALKQFLYSELCDVYIETTKPFLRSFSNETTKSCFTLILCLNYALKLLSIFMPYLCQELLNALPEVHSIYGAKTNIFFPKNEMQSYLDDSLEQKVQYILDIVSAIRRLRAAHNISKKQDMKVVIEMDRSRDAYEFLESQINVIKTLGACSNIIISNDTPTEESIFDTVNSICCVHLIPNNLDFDITKSTNKKYNKLLKERNKLQTIMSKSGYKEKAPQYVQDNHSNKLQSLLLELEKIESLQKVKTKL